MHNVLVHAVLCREGRDGLRVRVTQAAEEGHVQTARAGLCFPDLQSAMSEQIKAHDWGQLEVVADQHERARGPQRAETCRQRDL